MSPTPSVGISTDFITVMYECVNPSPPPRPPPPWPPWPPNPPPSPSPPPLPPSPPAPPSPSPPPPPSPSPPPSPPQSPPNIAVPGPWNGIAYGSVSYEETCQCIRFGGGYVDLGSRVLDGTAGISIVLWAQVAAPTSYDASVLPPPPYARMFDAGSGCVEATSRRSFACASAFFVGSGSLGTNLYAGATAASASIARGSFVQPRLRALAGGQWLAVAVTVNGAGTLRMYTGGAVGGGDVRSANIWTSSANGGLPAALYPTVYLGRSQNPAETTRWTGALSNIQLYFEELSALAVQGIFVGDSTSCSPAPPPPGSSRFNVNAASDMPFARVTAPGIAMRWVVSPDRFDENSLWWDDLHTVPIAAGPFYDTRLSWMDMRGGSMESITPIAPLASSAPGVWRLHTKYIVQVTVLLNHRFILHSIIRCHDRRVGAVGHERGHARRVGRIRGAHHRGAILRDRYRLRRVLAICSVSDEHGDRLRNGSGGERAVDPYPRRVGERGHDNLRGWESVRAAGARAGAPASHEPLRAADRPPDGRRLRPSDLLHHRHLRVEPL